MEKKYLLEAVLGQLSKTDTLLSCNQYTGQFGLSLTGENAKELLELKKESLKENGRVEFGEGILPKIIFEFCDSPYIYQDNYMESIAALQEIFYLYKNESLDELTDDELLSFMKEKFEGECQGSFEYLEDTVLEQFAREIREGSTSFMGSRKGDRR